MLRTTADVQKQTSDTRTTEFGDTSGRGIRAEAAFERQITTSGSLRQAFRPCVTAHGDAEDVLTPTDRSGNYAIAIIHKRPKLSLAWCQFSSFHFTPSTVFTPRLLL